MFLVMTFGPTDAPGFYSDMTNKFKVKWYMLFIETLCKIVTLINEQVKVTETDELFIGYKKIIFGSRTTIDDVFLLFSNLIAILVYPEFV